ncbi:MAG TPA: hypothetical protein VFI84_03340 [Candidatus Saccharimonadales bacterium]|nr:hypothetical protein [Candidatus Saccharimonadales bacterium]
MTAECREPSYGVGWGVQYRPDEYYMKALRQSGSILGDPDAANDLSLPKITEHEKEVLDAVKGILQRRQIIVLTLKPATQVCEAELVEITKLREPTGQEPEVEDSAGNTTLISDLCRVIAQGVDISLVELPK